MTIHVNLASIQPYQGQLQPAARKATVEAPGIFEQALGKWTKSFLKSSAREITERNFFEGPGRVTLDGLGEAHTYKNLDALRAFKRYFSADRVNYIKELKPVKFLLNNETLQGRFDPWVRNYRYVDDLMRNAPEPSFTSGASLLKNLRAGGVTTPTWTKSTIAGGYSPPALSAMHYGQLVGLDRVAALYQNGAGLSRAQILKEVFNPKHMLSIAGKNLNASAGPLTTIGNYFKKVVFNQNAKRLIEPFAEGKVLFGSLTALAMGLMAFSVVKAGRDGYKDARKQGKGLLRSVFEGAKDFLVQGIKALATWEIAGVGFAIGAGLFAVAFPMAGVATGLTGLALTLGSTAAGIAGVVGSTMLLTKGIFPRIFSADEDADSPEAQEA